jgi:hypothetical protein
MSCHLDQRLLEQPVMSIPETRVTMSWVLGPRDAMVGVVGMGGMR